MTPGWVGPTMAISLAVIALSFLAIGGGVLYLVIRLDTQMKKAKASLQRLRDDALLLTNRVKSEIESYADLSAETRERVSAGIDAVQTRLQDLDALVEVMQEEAEETALDVAAFVRTARHAGGVLGTARRMMQRRRRSAD